MFTLRLIGKRVVHFLVDPAGSLQGSPITSSWFLGKGRERGERGRIKEGVGEEKERV